MTPERGSGVDAARRIFKRAYKIGMIAATVTLAVLAYLAYRSSTPGTGDVLLSVVLGVLAFLTLLSIPKLDWQDEQAETYRGILDDMRSRGPISFKFTGTGEPPADTPTRAGGEHMTAPVSVEFAEPEVHRVDAELVSEARRMASEGHSIDDICRMIDPGHDSNDRMHREAFRRIVQAMIAES